MTPEELFASITEAKTTLRMPGRATRCAKSVHLRTA